MGHFKGYFEGAKTFLTPPARDNLGVKKVEAPSKYPKKWPLTLSLAAIKKSIEWRLQVQIAFLTEVDLAPSRPE